MVEIRTAAEQLAAEQQERATSATRVEQLVAQLEEKLTDLAGTADDPRPAAVTAPTNGDGPDARATQSTNGAGTLQSLVAR
jgi:hypothetical protein